MVLQKDRKSCEHQQVITSDHINIETIELIRVHKKLPPSFIPCVKTNVDMFLQNTEKYANSLPQLLYNPCHVKFYATVSYWRETHEESIPLKDPKYAVKGNSPKNNVI